MKQTFDLPLSLPCQFRRLFLIIARPFENNHMKRLNTFYSSALWLLLLGCACFWARPTLPAGEPASPGLNSKYLSVLRSGDVRTLRELLDRGAAPNARDDRGTTPL